jgi:hypothetical protein
MFSLPSVVRTDVTASIKFGTEVKACRCFCLQDGPGENISSSERLGFSGVPSPGMNPGM